MTHLTALLGWLARESRHISVYAQIFSLTWLALLFWRPAVRLRAVQAEAIAGMLDLGLHVLALAGISLWLTAFSNILTAADVTISLSPVFLAAFIALRINDKQRRQTARAGPAKATEAIEVTKVAGVQAGSSNDMHPIHPVWAVTTHPLTRIPAATMPIAAHNDSSQRSRASTTLILERIAMNAITVGVQRARRWSHMQTARVAGWVIAVYGLFLYVSTILRRPYFAPQTYPGPPGDPGLFHWYIGWVWFAVSHHQSPLITPAFGYPGTTNLMSQTSVVVLGVLFGWLYPLIGAAAVSNLIFLVNYLLILVFGNLTLKRLGVNRLFSWIGTALFLLIPYLSAQELGHLHLYFIGLHFILGYLVIRLFTSQKSPSILEGLAVGTSMLAIFYLSLELVLSTALFAMVMFICACAFAPRLLWAHGKRILTPAFLSGMLPPLLLIVPGLLNFLHSAGTQPILSDWYQQTFVNDLLSLILPTPIYLVHNGASDAIASHFTGGFAEIDGYITLPALILLVVAAARTWSSKLTRILVVSTVVMMVFSLGPALHVAGQTTDWGMPWQPLSRLPLLNAALPSRFGLYFEYAAILLLTLSAATYAREQRFNRLTLTNLINVGSLLLVGILWLPAPLPSAQFPSSAQILADHTVSSTYLDHKTVLFLDYLDHVAPLMGVLADSGNFSFRSPNNYGTPAADEENPAMLAALKVVDTAPSVFGSEIEAAIPLLHVQEVAFVSTDGQPIDPSLNEEVSADLGWPIYDINGQVVFWKVPAVVKSDKLTGTADYLYQAFVRYFTTQPPGTSAGSLTVQGLVNAGILPPTFLNNAVAPDPNWTSVGSWIGTWASNDAVAFSVNATPAAAQAILKKYGRIAVDVQYPLGTHVQADAQGNRVFSAAPNTPAQQLWLVFNTSQLAKASTQPIPSATSGAYAAG